MKRVYPLLIFCLLLGYTQTFAQNNNCGDVNPTATCPADILVCPMELTDPITITNAAALTLPDVEYAVIDLTQTSTAGTGPPIVGIDDDGIFLPSTYGLTAGQFDVVPISYNLAIIQAIIQAFLTQDAIPIVLSCCDAAITQGGVDICGDLNAIGINMGSDVMSLGQMLDLLQGNTNDTFSLTDFDGQIANLNTQLTTAPACGGGNTLCYSYGNNCTYTIVPNVITIATPHTMNETIEAAMLVSSTATVATGLTVIYHAGQCIELNPNFCVQGGANFTAEIQACN